MAKERGVYLEGEQEKEKECRKIVNPNRRRW